MARYASGSKIEAIKNMTNCAIRDQQALIDAHLGINDPESAIAIHDAKEWIKDFKRLKKILAGSNQQ
ncbi:hypothetical protein SAMN03080615_01622 [Amphritea atlantica]|uniref:Uncharacterized protein n=1 Tax=Amphritea atlantica TaxID=355243 RepID=A0A1H9GDH4_9GAMM|nr:hypothetical protein [Amphritea atlantica]SEQ48172.1 hypothetical protein SAMN03080615_01622 [Amphritea atlantica]